MGFYTISAPKRRRKPTKSKRLSQAKEEHEKWLASMGVGKTKLPVDKKGRRLGICDIPDYSTEKSSVPLSNSIGNGHAKAKNEYTGNEISGIVLNHKSNYQPVRRDNPQAAIDAARMRRG